MQRYNKLPTTTHGTEQNHLAATSLQSSGRASPLMTGRRSPVSELCVLCELGENPLLIITILAISTKISHKGHKGHEGISSQSRGEHQLFITTQSTWSSNSGRGQHSQTFDRAFARRCFRVQLQGAKRSRHSRGTFLQ